MFRKTAPVTASKKQEIGEKLGIPLFVIKQLEKLYYSSRAVFLVWFLIPVLGCAIASYFLGGSKIDWLLGAFIANGFITDYFLTKLCQINKEFELFLAELAMEYHKKLSERNDAANKKINTHNNDEITQDLMDFINDYVEDNNVEISDLVGAVSKAMAACVIHAYPDGTDIKMNTEGYVVAVVVDKVAVVDKQDS